MPAKNDLTPQAREGYESTIAKSPYLSTSSSDSAWHIGAWLRRTGRSAPRDVRPSVGHTYHVNGMKVRMDWVQGCTEIERIG
jgi:hypothetical protein